MSFSALHYLVPQTAGISQFYRDVLGMQGFVSADGVAFAFEDYTCKLNFQTADVIAYQSKPHDLYWKIGITLRNLDHAVDWLKQCDWPVSEPRQFRDIGYMCHITDPNGFTIELLQQGFEGNAQPAGDGHPIAGQATLAHITLRVAEIEAAKRYYERELGLNLLSVQPVSEYGFCLYFYSFEAEELPNPDPASVQNREWLWRRPYTILELQHLEGEGSETHKRIEGQSGFHGLSIMGSGEEEKRISSDLLAF